MIERAKELLGKDFLGVEAIRNMESKLKGIGVNVEFIIKQVPTFPYTEQDLQLAKRNKEMVVLRTDSMHQNGIDTPITILNFRELFITDPLGKKDTIFTKGQFGDLLKTKDFAISSGEILLGWSIVKKDILDNSTGKTWYEQEDLLKNYRDNLKDQGVAHVNVHRRRPMEVLWDTLLYHLNNNSQLLEKYADWTSAHNMPQQPYFVFVGYNKDLNSPPSIHHDPAWLQIYGVFAHGKNPGLGVCPAR